MNADNMCCISIVAMKRKAKPAIDKTNELWLRYIAASAEKYKIQNTWVAQYIIQSLWWCTNTNGSRLLQPPQKTCGPHLLSDYTQSGGIHNTTASHRKILPPNIPDRLPFVGDTMVRDFGVVRFSDVRPVI